MKVLLLAALLFISFTICFPVATTPTEPTTALEPRDEDPPSLAPKVFHSLI